MNGKQVTLLLGGTYHDFNGFGDLMAPWLRSSGHTVQVTDAPDVLSGLDHQATDVVLLYTCLGGTKEGGGEGRDFTPGQVSSLVDWVRRGGGLLALHASTVCGQTNLEMRRLLGGAFVSHPPDMFSFTVTPMPRDHSITRGIEAFEVFDEFYIQSHDESVEIHMTAVNRGRCHPMVWSRLERNGRVVHIAPGHDHHTWKLPAYRGLILQSLDWAAAPSAEPPQHCP